MNRFQDKISPSDLPALEYFNNRFEAIDLKVGLSSRSLTVLPDEIRRLGLNMGIPGIVAHVLSRISQLGLKELWLGGPPPMAHNRWKHSVGTFTAGYIWLKALQEDQRVPEHCMSWPLDRWDKVQAVMGAALLLHDYGHLPFAHLMDEVLQHINWVPIRGQSQTLESIILDYRLRQEELSVVWRSLLNQWLLQESPMPLDSETVRTLVQQLIEGQHGSPWLQTLVNSPIDADKIDYLRYDAAFLQDTDFPVQSRLAQAKPTQWLMEFLQDQEVNHAGLLCLHGRSAQAAADLWRERIFAYDRLYLAPELRVPDRMAYEIIQQFVIRSTMSDEVRKKSHFESMAFTDRFFHQFRDDPCSPDQIIATKYEAVKDMMDGLLADIDSDNLEFPLLKEMVSILNSVSGIDGRYKAFLNECLGCLARLTEKKPERKSWLALVHESLVREPIVISREDFGKSRELLRGVQYFYNNEVLIDIVRLPRVLGAPQRYASNFDGDRDIEPNILIPGGDIGSWGPGQRATRPLTDAAVRSLEMPYCRITVIAPGRAHSPKAAYVWDRVRSTLLEANIKVFYRKDENR